MSKFPTYPTLYDEVKRVSIADLRRWKYLEAGNYKAGNITWSINGTETGNISVAVYMCDANPYLELRYSINARPVSYRVSLVQVPSNLGKGFIWYFLCPQTAKRCRVLYLVGTRFLHREAVTTGAMYEGQTHSKKWRNLKRVFDDAFGLSDARHQKHFKMFYNDKPTKRFKKILDRYARISQLPEGELGRLLN